MRERKELNLTAGLGSRQSKTGLLFQILVIS